LPSVSAILNLTADLPTICFSDGQLHAVFTAVGTQKLRIQWYII